VAHFTVRTYLIDIDEDVADNKDLLEESGNLVKAVKKEVDGVPDSPAKTDMEAKLDALDEAVKPLPDQSPHLTQALAPFKSMVTQEPDAAPALQPLYDHLSQLDDETKKGKAEIEQEIAESEKGSKTCDAIDHATQALKAVPEMIGIAKKPWEFAAAFATNMAKSELPASAGKDAQAVGDLVKKLPGAAGKPSESLAENELEMGSETEIAEKLVEHIPEPVRETPGYKFAVQETKKFVPTIVDGTKSPIDMLDKATRLAGDVVAYANEQLFAKYCEKFEGQFTATMLAHFYSKSTGEGKPTDWWTYSTAIKGKLVIRYPKGATGDAVTLSGQLEGGATHFTYAENVFTTDLYGAEFGPGIYRTKDVAPAATDNAEGGMVTALTSPTSFYIPVTGQYANGKITIAMGDARTDFNETYTRGHTFFVVTAQRTLGLPLLGHFSLPYTNARFILNHVVNGDYTVETKGKTMVIEKIDHQERPANQNLAIYTINLKACNPACP
jgi:archaellum component FlaC